MANGYSSSSALENLNRVSSGAQTNNIKKINSLQIDTSEMPAAAIFRKFTVNGEVGAKFTLYIVQDDTLKYYDFIDRAFELGHNNKHNNLEITMNSKSYYGNIAFPSGGGTYTIKLLASSDTETTGSNKHIISTSISKQTANATLTFKAVTANTSNYATFPTTTTAGALASQASIEFDWDITNASTDGGGFGLRLTGPYETISENSWYFTTTEVVLTNPRGDGEDEKNIIVSDLTDIGVGTELKYHKGTTVPTNKAGAAVGTTTVTAINSTTKTITFSKKVAFEDGETMTFRAYGSDAIFNAIGSKITFVQYPTVTPTVLTKTVRANVSSSTTVTLNGTYGVAGGDLVKYTGVGVNNSSSNLVTSVTASSSAGSMVVELAQILTAGTVLTFDGCHSVINFIGGITVSGYPSANKTIYLDLDPFITVGAAS